MVFLAEHKLPIPSKDILSWYFDNPEIKNPDEPIYIDAADPSRFYTHRTAKSTIRKLIAGFRAQGLKQGSTVCLHSFNDLEYPIVVNGIVGFGGIFSSTNPSYTPYELAHAIRVSHVEFFLCEPELLDNVLDAIKDTSIPRENILIFDNREGQKVPEGFKSWRTLLEHGEEDWVRFDDAKTSKERTAARLFSSGTTGLPKAGIISHHNLITQHCQYNDYAPKPFEVIRLFALPMFHVACAPTMHFSPLRNGFKTYIMRRFELEPFLANMEKYEINVLTLVPPMVIQIIMSDLRKKYSLRKVRFAHCGAAPLDKGAQARLQELLADDAPFTQVWGMTETTCIATMLPYPEGDDTGSVGYPVPNLDIKLTDDAGNDVTGDDVRGELCIRGDSVINGYLDNPEANANSWDAEGFFHTGDIAYRDGKTKKWYIVDRKKELIKVRGFQVAPPELEAILLSHPHLVDAAVIGVQPSRDDSEYPRAYVVRRDSDEGKKLAEKDIYDFTADKLARFKRLEGGVVFIDAIPKNPSGKILKRILREKAEEEMGLKKEGRDAKM